MNIKTDQTSTMLTAISQKCLTATCVILPFNDVEILDEGIEEYHEYLNSCCKVGAAHAL